MTSMTPSDSHVSSVVLKTDRRGRVRTPAAKREALLDAFEDTCMSGAEFARHHGLAYPTFMNWLGRRRKAKSSEDPLPAPPGAVRFQEFLLDSESPAAPAPPGLMVELSGGRRLRIEHASQIPLAAALIRELEASSC